MRFRHISAACRCFSNWLLPRYLIPPLGSTNLGRRQSAILTSCLSIQSETPLLLLSYSTVSASVSTGVCPVLTFIPSWQVVAVLLLLLLCLSGTQTNWRPGLEGWSSPPSPLPVFSSFPSSSSSLFPPPRHRRVFFFVRWKRGGATASDRTTSQRTGVGSRALNRAKHHTAAAAVGRRCGTVKPVPPVSPGPADL